MLPSLTITFLLGLALGSYLPYFPISIAIFLTASTIGGALLERQGRITSRQSIALLTCLFGGCLYWTVFAWLTSHAPVPDHSAAIPARLVGTIIESVQHAPGRLTALV